MATRITTPVLPDSPEDSWPLDGVPTMPSALWPSGAASTPSQLADLGPAQPAYHHRHLRAAVLDTSVRLIGEMGISAFSLRDAAREVGVTPGAIYRHFTSKSDLLAELALIGLRLLTGRMAQARLRALATHRGQGKAMSFAVLAQIGVAYCRFAVQESTYFELMFSVGSQSLSDLVRERARAENEVTAHDLLIDAICNLPLPGGDDSRVLMLRVNTAWSVVHGLANLYHQKMIHSSCEAEFELQVTHALRSVTEGLKVLGEEGSDLTPPGAGPLL
jgi:AcrR family transcriptional regulator